MTEPTASVVIPTLNRPERVRRCLESVLSGEKRPEQVIICDQSRNSDTRFAVEALARDSQGVEIDYLHLDAPATSAARNAGLQVATCPLIAFIDDDCVADPAWLAALAGSYVTASGGEMVSAICGRVLPVGAGRRTVALSSRASTRRRYFRAGQGGLERGEWAPWDVGTGANILAPLQAVLAVGGFDPRLGPGTGGSAAEDIDLLYRLARAGTLVYEPDAIVYHPAGTREARLKSRYRYGWGMGSMLALHMAEGDKSSGRIAGLYFRHQSAEVLRRGAWGPVEWVLTLAGASIPLVTYRIKELSKGMARIKLPGAEHNRRTTR